MPRRSVDAGEAGCGDAASGVEATGRTAEAACRFRTSTQAAAAAIAISCAQERVQRLWKAEHNGQDHSAEDPKCDTADHNRDNFDGKARAANPCLPQVENRHQQ